MLSAATRVRTAAPAAAAPVIPQARTATAARVAPVDGFTAATATSTSAITGVPQRPSAPASPVETWVKGTFQDMLNRQPTAGELQACTRAFNEAVAQGKHPFAAGANIVNLVKAGAEYKRLHPLADWFEREYQTNVGRSPSMREIKQGETSLKALTDQGKGFFQALQIGDFCLKISDESKAYRAAHPLAEWTQNAFFDTIGRAATPEEIAGSEQIFHNAGNVFAGGAFISALLRQKPEFKTKYPLGPWIDGLYSAELGRPASIQEIQKGSDFMSGLMKQGKNVFEAGAAMKYCLALSPEWQARHANTGPDAKRAQIAQWAIAQANDPNIGYSQTAGRFGNVTDRNGHRYFDCSGLVFSAYQHFGVTLGGNWTGAMQSTWRSWADQVPKNVNAMKPGDLLLMNGHVVMYTGNGRCVGAQTSHTAFQDQVTANIDVYRYLNRSDCMVLRPRV